MKTLVISAKCSDAFWAELRENGKKVSEYDGYVPDFMPGEHFGDYVELEIDIETGVILDWKPNEVAAAIKGGLFRPHWDVAQRT